jgi:glycosyltransferase involved in cell wall biosynthesis
MHSIVILTKDQQWQLEHILYSISQQTVLPDEVIIVNNASIEPYEYDFDNYNFKINYIKLNDKPECRSRGRNIGYENASGDIITFLDGDTTLYKDYVSKVQNHFKLYPKSFLQGTRLGLFSKKFGIKIIYDEQFFYQKFGVALQNNLLKKYENYEQFYSANFSLIKTKELGDKLFDEAFNGWGFEDTELAYRGLRQGFGLYELSNLLSLHFEHVTNNITQETKNSIFKNAKYFVSKYPEDEDLYSWVEGFVKSYCGVDASLSNDILNDNKSNEVIVNELKKQSERIAELEEIVKKLQEKLV